MISQRKLEANRLNAQKSTGPVTARGKAISSRNALKTGKYVKVLEVGALIAEKEIEELYEEFAGDFAPRTREEKFCVESLANAEWQIRKLMEIYRLSVRALMRARLRAKNESARLAVVPRRKDDRATWSTFEAFPPAA